jgi:hypothetical protein
MVVTAPTTIHCPKCEMRLYNNALAEAGALLGWIEKARLVERQGGVRLGSTRQGRFEVQAQHESRLKADYGISVRCS